MRYSSKSKSKSTRRPSRAVLLPGGLLVLAVTYGCSSDAKSTGPDGGSRGSGGATGGTRATGTGGAKGETGGAGGAKLGSGGVRGNDADGASTDAARDSATTGLVGDSGSASCVGRCASGTVCVEDQTIGGVALYHPNDAGVCPSPLVVVPEGGNNCWGPPSFHCAELSAVCRELPSCTCAASLCNDGRVASCTEANATHVRCLSRAP